MFHESLTASEDSCDLITQTYIYIYVVSQSCKEDKKEEVHMIVDNLK